MKKSTKLSMVAAAIALSTLAAPVAQAGQFAGHVSRDTGVGRLIAAQGNVALRTIRAELKAALLTQKPVLPASAYTTKVAVTSAGGAGPGSANARCAK